MSARSKSGATKLRRRRDTRSAREPIDAQGQPADACAGERAGADETAGAQPHQPRRRREPAPQDVALYSCQCGFVFEAAVSTSVGCPHCGDSQAW